MSCTVILRRLCHQPTQLLFSLTKQQHIIAATVATVIAAVGASNSAIKGDPPGLRSHPSVVINT